MSNKRIYTKEVYEGEDGEYYLDLGDIAEELGWKEGDTLIWKDNGDGSWSLSKFTRDQAGL